MPESLISLIDLENRLGRTLHEDEGARAVTLLDDVSQEVREVAGKDFLDEDGNPSVPASIARVVFNVVNRNMANPLAHTQQNTGNYSWSTRGSNYLTKQEQVNVRRAVGKHGAQSIGLEGLGLSRPDDILGS